MEENGVGTAVVESAIAVHREIGPGLLESVYEVALAYELRERGLEVKRQVPVSFEYRGLKFEEGFRLDLQIESRVIVEVKCVEQLNNAHRKQLLTYLRLTGNRLGYILNFSEPLMKQGILRVVCNLD